MTFGERVIDYYGDLQIKANLPQGVEVLNPYLDDRSEIYVQSLP